MRLYIYTCTYRNYLYLTASYMLHNTCIILFVALHEEMDGKEYVVEFDFLGKDSIRYYNKVPVEKQVFKNLKIFVENKEPGDDLFDRLTVSPSCS